MQSANFKAPNRSRATYPVVIYEATCKCSFNKNIPGVDPIRTCVSDRFRREDRAALGSGVIYGQRRISGI